MIEDTNDERAIQRVITRISHALDARRWGELRGYYGDVVVNDFTSLHGGEAQEQGADDMLATWKKFHDTIGASQHFLGPIDVEVRGKEASAECHVRAYHFLARAPEGEEWMVAGHYRYGLIRGESGWKVSQVKFEMAYQSGNAKMFEQAGL